ncbi:MAG: hypothetical protein ACI9FB_001741 [Candidatus Azotimanducaceae bacterium]|jgi:hypothetical protein
MDLSYDDSEQNIVLLLWNLREVKLAESIESVSEIAVYIAANHEQDRAGIKSAILIDSHLNVLLFKKMTEAYNCNEEELKLIRFYREAI